VYFALNVWYTISPNWFLLLKVCFFVLPSYSGLRFTDRASFVCQSGQSTQGGRTAMMLAAAIGA